MRAACRARRARSRGRRRHAPRAAAKWPRQFTDDNDDAAIANRCVIDMCAAAVCKVRALAGERGGASPKGPRGA
eukprot:1909474-Prymnesium_polylepis.1